MKIHHARAVILGVLTALGSVVSPRSAPAQAPDSTSLRHLALFTRDDAYLGLGFVGATLALAPLDKHVALDLQRPAAQNHPLFQNLATDVRLLTSPGSIIIGTGLYVVGRVGHFDRVADLGLHGTEAIFVGSVFNDAIKDLVGRARPYVVGDTNPHDFQVFRGLRKGEPYSSFPSGHTLAAFAVAAAVTDEAARSWPGAQWYVGPIIYAGASSVALERLYNNKHWLSDVVMAAGIGIFAGNKVVRFNHRTAAGNRVDRWLLPSSVREQDGRVALVWSLNRD